MRPVFKRIDTCAAEFASPTAYMYSTYEAPFAGGRSNEAAPSDRKKVIILGGGPNRIGQGIEFDYCCCHACFALHDAGFETIMVNCNPETVSTDYDTSDRLYFEPLTPEDVLEIVDVERSKGTLHGVIVQFGGQTPLKLAEAFDARQSADPRHLAGRDRPRRGPRPFQAPAREARRARSRRTASPPRRKRRARSRSEIGYPVVIRPSYVLGGRAMEIVRDDAHSSIVISRGSRRISNRPSELVVCAKSPLLIDRYLSDATRSTSTVSPTARTRSSPASWSTSRRPASIRAIPPVRCRRTRCRLRPSPNWSGRRASSRWRCNVGGLMNVQYAIKDGDIYVLEVNPRASRTVPFVAKVIGMPVAKIASRVMAGESLASFNLKAPKLKHAPSRKPCSRSRASRASIPCSARR